MCCTWRREVKLKALRIQAFFGINWSFTRSLEGIGVFSVGRADVFLIKSFMDTHWDKCEAPWRRSSAAISDSSIKVCVKNLHLSKEHGVFPHWPSRTKIPQISHKSFSSKKHCANSWTVSGWLAVDELRTSSW